LELAQINREAIGAWGCLAVHFRAAEPDLTFGPMASKKVSYRQTNKRTSKQTNKQTNRQTPFQDSR